MRAIRLIAATSVASLMTVFAVLGMVHLIEMVAGGLGPSPIAVSRHRLDFGKIPLHASATQELIVRNDGAGAVHARFVVAGTTYRVEPAELVLEPGIEWSIAVEVSPEKPGPLDDILQIQIVGGDSLTLVIPLAAEGGADENWGEPDQELNRA